MKQKHSYRATDVEHIDVDAITKAAVVGCIVAIDVAKTNFVAGLATAEGEMQKLVKFEHPRQTLVFLKLLEALQKAERRPVVVMEPTGTYGDAVRYQCHALGLPG
jgi:transposase